MKTLRVVFLNSAVQVIGKVISAGSTVLISAIIARSLGQIGFGEFTIMTVYAGFFAMAVDFGFNAITLREAKGDGEKAKEQFQDLLGLRIVYSLVLIFIALALLSFFPYSNILKLATIVILLTIINSAIYMSANLIFQFKLRYDLSVIVSSTTALLNLALIYLLSKSGLNIVSIAMVYVLTGAVGSVVALWLVGSNIGGFKPRFDTKRWLPMIITTLPVGITLIFNVVYFRADTFILSFFKSSSDVGIYGAAYKIFDLALVFPSFFMNAMYPVLVKTYEEDRAKFIRMVRYSLIALVAIAVLGTAVALILAPFLVHLVYTDKFDSSILPFQILVASSPIFFVSSLYMWLLILMKRQKQMAVVYGIGMIINVALNLYFIPKYSYLAAAVITGVSEALILIMTFSLARGWSNENRD